MALRAMPTHNGPPPKHSPSIGAPNQSLYISNLPDKLQKSDLRLSLYTLFSTYGPVLDVVAMKTAKMRGQAHIAFRDVHASTQAMRALQDFDFFGKQMVTTPKSSLYSNNCQYADSGRGAKKIQYAKGKSNTIAKLDGTYRVTSTTSDTIISTDLQKSIFNAPPSSNTAAPPAASSEKAPQSDTNGVKLAEGEPHGIKRGRENESDEEGAPMEEDSDAPMDASSDEDE